MSITNYIDQNKPADTWVNLRCNRLTIDDKLILQPDALAAASQCIISGTTFSATSQNLLASNFYAVSPSSGDIPFSGINYNVAAISVFDNGYYLIDLKLIYQLVAFSPGDVSHIEAIFWDVTSAKNVIYDTITLDSAYAQSIVLNRIVYLDKSKTYQIIIKNNYGGVALPVQILIEAGTYTSSYLSIIKLFNI